jgi:hypothetical protein
MEAVRMKAQFKKLFYFGLLVSFISVASFSALSNEPEKVQVGANKNKQTKSAKTEKTRKAKKDQDSKPTSTPY